MRKRKSSRPKERRRFERKNGQSQTGNKFADLFDLIANWSSSLPGDAIVEIKVSRSSEDIEITLETI